MIEQADPEHDPEFARFPFEQLRVGPGVSFFTWIVSAVNPLPLMRGRWTPFPRRHDRQETTGMFLHGLNKCWISVAKIFDILCEIVHERAGSSSCQSASRSLGGTVD